MQIKDTADLIFFYLIVAFIEVFNINAIKSASKAAKDKTETGRRWQKSQA